MTDGAIAVAGGGLLGLTLAWRLARAGRAVTVFEAAPHLGGLAAPWRLGDITWDRHYHVTLASDLHLRGLLAELGLERELRWTTTRSGFFADGRVIPMDTAWDFLRFPLLNLWSKFRLGLTILRASRIDDITRMETMTAVEWLTKWSGRSAVERVWKPLLRSKLGDSADRVSAAFIAATIARLYAARRAGLKREEFGYVPGGYATILARFAAKLADGGVSLRTGCPVREVTSGGGVVFVNGERFAAAVLTVPAPVAAEICPQFDDATRTKLQGVDYHGIVCASALLTRPVSGNYVLNLLDERLPFTGVIEMTALVDPSEFGGRHLIYLPRYAGPDDAIWNHDDDTIRGQYVAGIQRIQPALTDREVLAFQVSRVRHVYALPTLNYSTRLPPARTNVPGVYVVTSAQIVGGTLNVNETVGQANAAAAWLLSAAGRDHVAAAPANPWVGWWRTTTAVAPDHQRAELRQFLAKADGVLQWQPHHRVLDIGCGRGWLAEELSGRVKSVTAADVNTAELNHARIRLSDTPEVTFHEIDPIRYTTLTIDPRERFHRIVVLSVAQYYRDYAELASLFAEIQTRLTPDGLALITDIPDRSGGGSESVALLRSAWRERRLWRTLRAGCRLFASPYREIRRRHGLLTATPQSLTELAARHGLHAAIVPDELSTVPGRIHLLLTLVPSPGRIYLWKNCRLPRTGG